MIDQTKQVLPQHTENNIQCICNQIKADIDAISYKQDAMSDDEKFETLHKINELKQILSSIEDIDQSLNALLSQQHSKPTIRIM